MRNHRKVKSIRSKFGPVGYAIWVMVLEYLTGNDGNVFEYSDMEFEIMSGDFGVSATEIRDTVNYCISLEMLFNKDGFIHSPSLDERLAPVYQKRGLAKRDSEKQIRLKGRFVVNNTGNGVVSATETMVTATETPHSKVKESKENESKVNIVAGTPATIDQRKKDFYDQCAKHVDKYSKEMLREFYNYWTEMNDGGKKMRFEMQKIFGLGRRLATWKSNEDKKINGNGKQNKGTSRGSDAKVEYKGFGTWDGGA